MRLARADTATECRGYNRFALLFGQAPGWLAVGQSIPKAVESRLFARVEPSGREYLIVDGHSIIFAWPELRVLQGGRSAAAREALIRTLTDYQDQSGVRVVVVFDGRGAKISQEDEPGGIQVFYSPDGRTADSLVERLVAKYAATHRLTVATSDHMEQQTAISFGAASCLSAEQLKVHLEAAGREFDRRLDVHRRDRRRFRR